MPARSFAVLPGIPPALRWGLIGASAVLLPAILYEGSRTGILAQTLAGFSIGLLGIHAAVVLGIARAAVFAGICLTITFTIENIGVATGVPFGRYVFLVGEGLPHVGTIPVIVGGLWFAFGYQAWIIACLLVGAGIGGPRDRLSLWGVPLVAAFVATQWDVVVEPSGATIGRAWVWFDGGGYFGVPLSNFLGWLLTTWTFFQFFALVVYLTPLRRRWITSDPVILALPVLLYLASGLCHLMPLLDPDTRIADATGKVWSSADIREATAIAALLTMLPTSCLALIRLMQVNRFPASGEAVPQASGSAISA